MLAVSFLVKISLRTGNRTLTKPRGRVGAGPEPDRTGGYANCCLQGHKAELTARGIQIKFAAGVTQRDTSKMVLAPKHEDEDERLAELESYGALDSAQRSRL